MIDENLLYNLLSKIGSSLKANINPDSKIDCGFNIFNVLGVSSKEVIICRFLGELLNPDGSHSMGYMPVLKFVNEVLEIKDFNETDAANAYILLEESTDESRRVDIAIHSGNRVFPIEVKIWAGDQYAQLDSYFKFYKIHLDLDFEQIFYLTPTGWEPSEKSKGQLRVGKEIKCLSFEKNIKNWIMSLMLECKEQSVKMIMEQFIGVIDKMSANNKDFEVIKRALDLSFDDYECTPELEAAVEIIKQGDKIKRQIQQSYLMKYVKLDTNKYEISADVKDGEPDSHVIMKIITKDDGKTVAWLCINTNLYLVAREVKNAKEKWHRESKPGFNWQRIAPGGKYKGYNMSEPDKFINDKRYFDFNDLLEDIIISDETGK